MAHASDDGNLTAPPMPATRVGRALSRQRAVAFACLAALAISGWLYLGLMVAGMVQTQHAGALGPGMAVFDLLLGAGTGEAGKALIHALCRPTFGSAGAVSGLANLGLVLLMWSAMTLAMMLPTAAPMVMTYAEIAETAARKGERVASPLALAAGYAAVWIGFAVMAVALQAVLARAALIDPAMASASPLFSGAVFLGAGAYQFSAVKQACLTRCQRPFPFFLAHWATSPRGVFRLGARQGLYCLGCCWAMMLVMFAVGAMNVVWMAVLGIIMGTEKLVTTTRFSRAVGIVFALIGAVVIARAVAAHWPAHAI
jgi:predicted metal-binding membrane protein